MSAGFESSRWEEASVDHRVGFDEAPATAIATSSWIQGDERQLRRMLKVAFVVLLVPATLAWLTGWRWRPWPAGPEGYRSVVSEARSAADSVVPVGFMGW